jgi:hypothetical protein
MPHPDPVVCQELTEMKKAIDAIGRKMDALHDGFSLHVEEEAKQSPQLQELIDAWNKGIGVVQFIKIMAGVGVFLSGLYVFLSSHITWR